MNSKIIGLILISIFLSGCIQFQNQTVQNSDLTIQTFFCPEDPCESAVLNELNQAKQSVHLAMYSFTLDSIGDELIQLKEKGIEVLVVVEKQQLSQYSQYEKLKEAGVNVRIDSNPQFMHNKFAIIDGKTVLNGSMNWTSNGANENNENFSIIHSQAIASEFETEFQSLFSTAKIQ